MGKAPNLWLFVLIRVPQTVRTGSIRVENVEFWFEAFQAIYGIGTFTFFARRSTPTTLLLGVGELRGVAVVFTCTHEAKHFT